MCECCLALQAEQELLLILLLPLITSSNQRTMLIWAGACGIPGHSRPRASENRA